MNDKKYLLVINYLPRSILEAVTTLREDPQWANLTPAVITNQPANPGQHIANFPALGPVQVLVTDYRSSEKISAALMPIADRLAGVTCRGDKNIQYLRKVIPALPAGVRVATPTALKTATDKSLMRVAFQKKFPQISPRHLVVQDASPANVAKVEAALGYPLIIKPSNLASSLLVQVCSSRSELQRVLCETFDTLKDTYMREQRQERPQVIAEEYLEGDFYSIDAYVMGPDEVHFCPPVGYVPAKQLGIDDFFIYKRSIEPHLSKEEIEAANRTARQAISAIGLLYSSVHIELVRTARGWKVIELGPRLGRFRNHMYGISYGIDHSLNDIKVHLGISPEIPAAFKAYCAGYCIYPAREGILKSLVGIEWAQNDPRVSALKVFASPGQHCKYAKHGGHVLAEFIVASQHKDAYDTAVQAAEEGVYADID